MVSIGAGRELARLHSAMRHQHGVPSRKMSRSYVHSAPGQEYAVPDEIFLHEPNARGVTPCRCCVPLRLTCRRIKRSSHTRSFMRRQDPEGESRPTALTNAQQWFACQCRGNAFSGETKT
jgi:hypothetical protein